MHTMKAQAEAYSVIEETAMMSKYLSKVAYKWAFQPPYRMYV